MPRKITTDKGKMSQELSAKITNIDNVGEVTLIFNRDIIVPNDFN